MKIRYYIFVMVLCFSAFFAKSQLEPSFEIPQLIPFEQVGINGYNRPSISIPNNSPNLYRIDNSIQQRNLQIIREADLVEQKRMQAKAEIESDLTGTKFYRDHLDWLAVAKPYRIAFQLLNKSDPDHFSISKAVFAVENAFYDNKFKYETFEKAFKLRADLVKQILKREHLYTKSNTALNYGIMKLYQQNNNYYDKQTKKTFTIKPFSYDFEDSRGEKDYTKMFTSKLLATGKGQCHSMPLTYLIIAEQLGAKAYLSMAPQHSFIQFIDDNGNLMNFETTNGHLVTSNWMERSGFITSTAIKAKTYMDTLTQRQLFAQCLADLLLGYMSKFYYDDFAEEIRQKILQINPNNLTANIIDANVKTLIAQQAIKAAGTPKPIDLPKFPEAYKAFTNMQAAYDKVDNLGYQDMPKEAYQKWLKTIETEKRKQENRELEEKMKYEIKHIKKPKLNIINKSN